MWEWQRHSACRLVSPETFFHPEGERDPRKFARERKARTVCAACPVLLQCRRHTLEVREPYGVWGGLSEEDRYRIYRGTPIEDLTLPGLV